MKIPSIALLLLSLPLCPHFALAGDDESACSPINKEQRKIFGQILEPPPERQEQRRAEWGSEVADESEEGLTEEEKAQRKEKREAEAKRRCEERRKHDKEQAQQWVETRNREIREANERREKIRQQEEQEANAAREREARRLKNEEARRWLDVKAEEIRKANEKRLAEDKKDEPSKSAHESNSRQSEETGKRQTEDVPDLISQNYAKRHGEEPQGHPSGQNTNTRNTANKNAAGRHEEQQTQTKQQLQERDVETITHDIEAVASDLLKMLSEAMSEASGHGLTLDRARAKFYFATINKYEIRLANLEKELQEAARKEQTPGNALLYSISIQELRQSTKEAIEEARELISSFADGSM